MAGNGSLMSSGRAMVLGERHHHTSGLDMDGWGVRDVYKRHCSSALIEILRFPWESVTAGFRSVRGVL